MDFSDEDNDSLYDETLTEEVSDNCVSTTTQVSQSEEHEISKETQRTRVDEDFAFNKMLDEGELDFVSMATPIPAELEARYKKLLSDVEAIVNGVCHLPNYQDFGNSSAKTNNNVHRKKRNRWTHEEHRQFLEGLKMYGKGSWIKMSRNCLPTKTPTQIASHAQKYYLRQASQRKRPSIHDINTTNYRPDNGISQSQPNNNVMPHNINNDVGPRNINNDVTTRNINNIVGPRNINNDVTTRNINNDVTTRNINNDVGPRNINSDVTTRNINKDVGPRNS